MNVHGAGFRLWIDVLQQNLSDRHIPEHHRQMYPILIPMLMNAFVILHKRMFAIISTPKIKNIH